MLQMSIIQLKALLNETCKVVDKACTFLLGNHFNLLSDSCGNGARVALVDVLFENLSPGERNLGGSGQVSKVLILLYICGWKGCSSSFSQSHAKVTFVAWRLAPSYWNQCYYSSGSSYFLSSPQNSSTGMYALLSLSLHYSDHLQRKIVQWCQCFEMETHTVHVFEYSENSRFSRTPSSWS